MSVTSLSKLNWSAPSKGTIECVGGSFLDYQLRVGGQRTFQSGSLHEKDSASVSADASRASSNESAAADKKPQLNLLEISSEELEKITYYEVLGNLPFHATSEQVKKAYHKACIKYHPDKTGRGEEDEVFLKVKAAFDTLIDREQRKAYDSTHLDFDESIPKEGVSADEFYSVYGPVFERNLRFDARLLEPGSSSNNKSSGGGSKKNRKKQQQSNKPFKAQPPPSFGDDNSGIEDVHKFYEYWIHFESWRDFTLMAAKEEDEHYDPDGYDSRYEKRWKEKEIAKKAAKLKRDEMSRINLLVERAMAADPRIQREKQREKEEKERRVRERVEKKKAEEEAAKAEQERKEKEAKEKAEAEKSRRAAEKAKREREKKQLRKARNSFRKVIIAAYQQDSSHWKGDMEAMNDDLEYLCQHLNAVQLDDLGSNVGSNEVDVDASQLPLILEAVEEVKSGRIEELEALQRKRRQAREADEAKRREQKQVKQTDPWSKEELSALAKAVKKYPPGGANRWDTIALFINNLCKPTTPRTKEECIEKYNHLAQGKLPARQSSSDVGDSAASQKKNGTDSSANNNSNDGAWTDEQNQALQKALKEFPSSMNKNERWTAIARAVPGRTKKECVARFKAIREALKKK